MDALTQIKPTRKHDRLVVASFAAGLVSLLFPRLSLLYLVSANGGPGYLQSLFCGIPFGLAGIISGTIFLVQTHKANKRNWMAMGGILLGFLFFVIFGILVFNLLRP
jgi:hypothetical protein